MLQNTESHKLPETLKIREDVDSDAWDRYVRQNRESEYTHLFNWSRVIEEVYGHKPFYLAATGPGSTNRPEICGILPLFRFKTFLNAPRIVSVPFFDAAGILAKDVLTREFLFKKGLNSFSPKTISSIELRQGNVPDMKDFKLMGRSPEIFSGKVGLQLHLSGSQNSVFHQFKSKLRSQIKKSEKSGLSWKIGKKELIDPFYRVFSRNMRDLGSPVHAKKFFETVFDHFYQESFLCVVFYKTRPVASSFMFRFKNRLANPWASSLRECRYLNANLYLYWQMIRFACNMGIEIFDMGRSSRNASTYRFKNQFGPVEKPLYWYAWSFPGKRGFQREETLSIGLWKKMPLGIANLIGPLVRRSISL